MRHVEVGQLPWLHQEPFAGASSGAAHPSPFVERTWTAFGVQRGALAATWDPPSAWNQARQGATRHAATPHDPDPTRSPSLTQSKSHSLSHSPKQKWSRSPTPTNPPLRQRPDNPPEVGHGQFFSPGGETRFLPLGQEEARTERTRPSGSTRDASVRHRTFHGHGWSHPCVRFRGAEERSKPSKRSAKGFTWVEPMRCKPIIHFKDIPANGGENARNSNPAWIIFVHTHT